MENYRFLVVADNGQWALGTDLGEALRRAGCKNCISLFDLMAGAVEEDLESYLEVNKLDVQKANKYLRTQAKDEQEEVNQRSRTIEASVTAIHDDWELKEVCPVAGTPYWKYKGSDTEKPELPLAMKKPFNIFIKPDGSMQFKDRS